MILIADCGSTKIDWCLLKDGVVDFYFTTVGMNANIASRTEVETMMITALVPNIGENVDKIRKVFFYGAGCISAMICGNVQRAIHQVLPNAEIQVHTDLLGACRAVLGNQHGIACIMGTGSNSCYYDGTKIIDNVSPLGFILGDEGSGAVLGKILVGDVLKHQLPEDICKAFLAEYSLDTLSIVQHVYREPQPNRFLGSFAPFLKKHIDNPAIHKLVYDSFRSFFTRNLCQYRKYGVKEVGFCGSIAFNFSDILAEVAKDFDFVIGNVIKSPMEGLIAYHKDK